jgi:hypothetical protein
VRLRLKGGRGVVAGGGRSGQFGDAEVEELGQTVRANHHIVGFDIAMHDPRGMCVIQCRDNLNGDVENEPVIGCLRLREFGQSLPVDELRGDEVRAVGLADLVNGDDVRMIQRRRRLGLANETVHSVSVVGEFRRQDLEGDFTAKRRILREIHLAHPAFADWRQDPVLPDDGVRCKRLHMSRPEGVLRRFRGRRRPQERKRASGPLAAARLGASEYRECARRQRPRAVLCAPRAETAPTTERTLGKSQFPDELAGCVRDDFEPGSCKSPEGDSHRDQLGVCVRIRPSGHPRSRALR